MIVKSICKKCLKESLESTDLQRMILIRCPGTDNSLRPVMMAPITSCPYKQEHEEQMTKFMRIRNKINTIWYGQHIIIQCLIGVPITLWSYYTLKFNIPKLITFLSE